MHFFQEQLADTVLPSADNSKDKLELSEPPQTWAKSDVIDPDGTLISISEEFEPPEIVIEALVTSVTDQVTVAPLLPQLDADSVAAEAAPAKPITSAVTNRVFDIFFSTLKLT